MGLAIDGNEVHGIARGGQAFVSIESANKDGSLNIGGRKYVTMPVSFTIPKGTHLSNGDNADGFDLNQDCDVTCVGTSDKFYYFCGEIYYTQSDRKIIFVTSNGENSFNVDNPQDVYGNNNFNSPMFVKKNEVKKIRWQ